MDPNAEAKEAEGSFEDLMKIQRSTDAKLSRSIKGENQKNQ